MGAGGASGPGVAIGAIGMVGESIGQIRDLSRTCPPPTIKINNLGECCFRLLSEAPVAKRYDARNWHRGSVGGKNKITILAKPMLTALFMEAGGTISAFPWAAMANIIF